MLGEIFRTPQVGVLAGEGEEVNVVGRTVLGVVGRKRDDGRRAGSVVISPGIINMASQIAQMVIMRREHVAAVVAFSFHLGDNVEEAVVLQKFILNVHADRLHARNGLRGGPDDGFVHHAMPVGLVKLDGGGPGLDESRVGTFPLILQAGEFFFVRVCEPEIAADEAIGIFRLGQVGIEPIGIEIQRIYVIDRKFPAYAGGVLPHRKVYAGLQLFAVGPHFHLAGEGVDVDGERLERDGVGPGLPIFLLKVFPGLVGPVLGIAPPLILGGTQFLYDPFVVRQVLRVDLQGGRNRQQDDQHLFHSIPGISPRRRACGSSHRRRCRGSRGGGNSR